MRYTLRDVPEAVDHELRRRARHEKRSLSRVAVEALARGLGVDPAPGKQRELGDLAGRWRDDREVERALDEQRGIGADLEPRRRRLGARRGHRRLPRARRARSSELQELS
jgi:hypothetical protein